MLKLEQKYFRPKFARFFTFIDEFGNSLALYTLLVMILVGIWLASPIPSPDWTIHGGLVGWMAIVFICLSAIHGLLWWVITRELFHLPTKVKHLLSSSIKLVKPLHMMTGMLGLGFGFIHGFAFIHLTAFWNIYIISGIIALITLFILAIDGIGLMMSPFLSRKIHRWIATVFLFSVVTHLFIIFT